MKKGSNKHRSLSRDQKSIPLLQPPQRNSITVNELDHRPSQTHFKSKDPINKEFSYSRVISNYRISDWIKKFCVKTLKFKKKEKPTFIDDKGVKRYLDNWQPAIPDDVEKGNDIEHMDTENYFFRTGCMKLSHIYDYYRQEQEAEVEETEEAEPAAGKNEAVMREEEETGKAGGASLPTELSSSSPLNQYAYISEWQRLWIFLENDSTDELAKQAPLFRLLIAYLFHPRMQTFMTVLIIYNYLLNILLVSFFPSAFSFPAVFYIFFELTIQWITYFAIVIVYNGFVSDPEPTEIFNIIDNVNTAFGNMNSNDEQQQQQQHQQMILDDDDEGETIDDYTENPMRSPKGGSGGKSEPEMNTHHLGSQNHLSSPISDGRVIRQGSTNDDESAFSGLSSLPKIMISTITDTTNTSNDFRNIRRELISRIKYEIARLHPFLTKYLTTKASKEKINKIREKKLAYLKRNKKRKLSYHEILNISLKFLIKVNGINVSKINFDRWTYRLILLFIVCIFPLYIFFGQYLLGYLYAIVGRCNHSNFFHQEQYCEFFIYYFILSFGCFTKFFVQMIFGMSVLTSLVSLAYGSEIAYRLADTWIVKFKSLRRVEEYDMEDFMNEQAIPVESTALITSPSATATNPSGTIAASSLLARSGSAGISGKPVNITDRSSLTKEEMIPTQKSKKINSHVAECEDNISEHPYYYWIKRDATEHYFFICEVFSACDKIWSPALTFIFFIGIGFCAVFVLYAAVNKDNISIWFIIELVIYCIVRLFILFLYPLLSLCHANAYIYELSNCFKRSSKNDYQLIGGCDQWIEFMINCPAAWTYNGLWITWDRVIGLIWTFAAAALTAVCGTVFSIFF
jgi:hypothetical protein